MYEGFKGEYLSRAHVLVSPALVVIIRDSLLLLCWVAGYRGALRGWSRSFSDGLEIPFAILPLAGCLGRGIANGTERLSKRI